MVQGKGLGNQGIIPRWLVPSDKGRIRINGKRLGDYGLFLHKDGIVFGDSKPRTSYLTVPGRDGAVDVSLRDRAGHLYEDARQITVTVGTTGLESDYIQTKMDCGTFHGSRIEITDGQYPGHWEGVATMGTWEEERNGFGRFVQAKCVITVEAYPFLIGEQLEVDVSQPGEHFIDGNRLVWPRFELTTLNASSVVIANATTGERLVLPAETQSGKWQAGEKLSVDMGEGVVTMGNDPYYAIDITSDWWRLQPRKDGGELKNRVELTGATGTMFYTPEWGF